MGNDQNLISWAAEQAISTTGQPYDTKTGAIDFAAAATTTLHDVTATFSSAAKTYATKANPASVGCVISRTTPRANDRIKPVAVNRTQTRQRPEIFTEN